MARNWKKLRALRGYFAKIGSFQVAFRWQPDDGPINGVSLLGWYPIFCAICILSPLTITLSELDCPSGKKCQLCFGIDLLFMQSSKEAVLLCQVH